MADAKTPYSSASRYYVEVSTRASEADRRAYENSKRREARYNGRWVRQKVNLNEVVDRLTPNDRGRRRGQKYVFEGERYNVVADMASGYLRIWDKKKRSHVLLDGTEDKGGRRGHYKIKRREEM